MQARLVLAAAICGTLALTMSGVHAATPVLDGKKVKTLTLKAASGVQDHDSDLVTETAKDPLGEGPGVDRAKCKPPRCAALTFVYKPAKGVRSDIGFALSWSVPTDDMDLYVAEVTRGVRSTVANCGAGVGTSEKIVLPYGTLRPGRTYALVADFYRAANATVTATVTLPNKVKPATTPATSTDEFFPVNCGL